MRKTTDHRENGSNLPFCLISFRSIETTPTTRMYKSYFEEYARRTRTKDTQKDKKENNGKAFAWTTMTRFHLAA